MPNLSLQLAQLFSESYAFSVSTSSVARYVKKASKQSESIKKDAHSGSARESMTKAVSYALSEARIGSSDIGKISMAASGLGLICSLPSAIEALSNLSYPGQEKSTQAIYQSSQASLNKSLQSLKQSLLATGSVIHDNAGRLLFSMPLDFLRSKEHYDLYPYIKEKLVKQHWGDSINFHDKWLTSSTKRAKLLRQYKHSLHLYDSSMMPKPIVSLGEVASYLSLLDPQKDKKQIEQYSALFKEMLFAYRQTLAQDKGCASLLDESNRFLSNLMVSTYVGRAHRNQDDAKIITNAKPVYSGVGIVISAALAVQTVGLSIPATAFLAVKLSSSTASTLSTALEISKMIRNGSTADEIEKLLNPEVLANLAKNDAAQQLLIGEKVELKDFIIHTRSLQESLHQIQQSLYNQIAETKSNPLFKLSEISQDKDLAKVFIEQAFMSELCKHLSRGMSAAELLITISQYIQTTPMSKPSDITQQLAKTQLLNAVCELMVEDNQLNRDMLVASAKKGELVSYLKGLVALEEHHFKTQLDSVRDIESQAQKLGLMKQEAEQTLLQAQRTEKRLAQKQVGVSSIEKLLHASEYTDYLNIAKANLKQTLLRGIRQIEQIEGKPYDLTIKFEVNHHSMNQKSLRNTTST